jgi:phosphorylcholine metabolism protein LicD
MDVENEYGTLDKQKYLLPILVDIDAFCRKHDIKYSISDGIY